MRQPLVERFYEATEYREWDKNTKLVESKVLLPWKTFEIWLVLFLWINCYDQRDHQLLACKTN